MEEQITILIADTRKELIDVMLKSIERDKAYRVIGVTGNGTEALEIAKAERPKILLTELSLEGMDGIKLIRGLQDIPSFCRPVTVVTSFDVGEDTKEKAAEAGANYILADRVQLDHIVFVLNKIVSDCFPPHSPTKAAIMTPKAIVDIMLGDVDVSLQSHGHDYLEEGILAAFENGCEKASVCKDIYPEVGHKLGVNAATVERMMRYSIAGIWVPEHDDALLRYLNMNTETHKNRPTNSDFIINAAKYVRDTLGKAN